ncbi:MAG TPA: NUDIX hydrolase [Blastocatellia bacterium]|nr:NUDIX hydrolase [Blastocatellia bacterium]
MTRKYCYDYPRPALTVDIVLFRRNHDVHEVLLIKRGREPFKDKWAFPGGFVDQDESLEDAAARELVEETGLTSIRLEQIGAFGDPGRDPRGHTVSVAFGAIINGDVKAEAGDDAAQVKWHSAARPGPLAFDHRKILAVALDHFRVNGARRAVRKKV